MVEKRVNALLRCMLLWIDNILFLFLIFFLELKIHLMVLVLSSAPIVIIYR